MIEPGSRLARMKALSVGTSRYWRSTTRSSSGPAQEGEGLSSISVRQFPESHADNHTGWKSILHGIRSQNLLSSAIYVMNSRPTSHDNTHLHHKTPRRTSASKHQRLTSSFIRSTYYVRSCSTGNTYHSSQSDAPSPMDPSIPRHSPQTNTTYLLASGTKARATVSSRPARLWIWCEHVRSGVLSSRRLL